jgi:signal transduction histidine kinase
VFEAVSASRIVPQQLAMIRAAMPAALVAQLGMIGACLLVLWTGPERGIGLAAWAVLATVATLARILLLRSWPRGPVPIEEAPRRRRLAVSAALLSGVIWGVLALLIQAEAAVERQMVVGLVLAVMCAGALGAVGHVKAVFYAFAVPALVPFAAVLLLGGGTPRTALGLLALLFLGTLILTSHRLERVLIGAFGLQEANSALVRHLTLARDEASAAAQAKNALISNLEESRREAESANQAKSTFLAIMSHELRTPLNAIIGFADVIRTQALGPMENARYREYIDDIRDSGAHLLELINKILDLSKIEAGKFDIVPERLSTEPVISSVLRLFRQQATSAGVQIRSEVRASAVAILADERALKQMMINLVSNALKFAPRGSIVRIVATGEADAVEISVSDAGVGIAPEDIEKAIQPFSQLGDPMTRRHEGTGLGLSLVKALIELHGGSLAIHSRPGSTTVRLRFPRAETETAGEAHAMGAPALAEEIGHRVALAEAVEGLKTIPD